MFVGVQGHVEETPTHVGRELHGGGQETLFLIHMSGFSLSSF